MDFVAITEFSKEIFKELKLKETFEINTDVCYQLICGLSSVKYYKEHKIWTLDFNISNNNFTHHICNDNRMSLIILCRWIMMTVDSGVLIGIDDYD